MITRRTQDCRDDHPFTAITIASNITLSTSVTGHGKFTECEFYVLAFTTNGNGPLSPVEVVRTSEEVRCQRQQAVRDIVTQFHLSLNMLKWKEI